MRIVPIKTSPMPPFMGGKTLFKKHEQKDNNFEYIKKWGQHDKKTI